MATHLPIAESMNTNWRSLNKKTRRVREDEWAPQKDSQDGEGRSLTALWWIIPVGRSFDMENREKDPMMIKSYQRQNVKD